MWASQAMEGGTEVGTQRRAGHRRAGRSGRVLGGGPAPESTGAWSQAGASVFIELSPSLHTEAWGLGAGGNAPLHLGILYYIGYVEFYREFQGLFGHLL